MICAWTLRRALPGAVGDTFTVAFDSGRVATFYVDHGRDRYPDIEPILTADTGDHFEAKPGEIADGTIQDGVYVPEPTWFRVNAVPERARS